MFLVVAAMTAMLSTSAFAAQNVDLKVTVDDTLVEFPDAKPFADDNNRTLIPVRFVTEAMGADVSWDQASQTAIIEKNGTKVEITIGKKDIKVTKDGSTKTVTMDTVAVAKDERTFVPIRFVAEALGAYVDYSDLYKAVEIVMPEEVTADEIKRLRSYDMIQYMDLDNRGEMDEWWLNMEEM